MPFTARCPTCSARLKISDSLMDAGKRFVCPKCNQRITQVVDDVRSRPVEPPPIRRLPASFLLALGIVLGFIAGIAFAVGVAAMARRMPSTENPVVAAKPAAQNPVVAAKPAAPVEQPTVAEMQPAPTQKKEPEREDKDPMRSAVLEFLRQYVGSVVIVYCDRKPHPGMLPPSKGFRSPTEVYEDIAQSAARGPLYRNPSATGEHDQRWVIYRAANGGLYRQFFTFRGGQIAVVNHAGIVNAN